MSENHADNIDAANQLMQIGIDIAIKNARKNLPPQLSKEERRKTIYRTCSECGNEIPRERVIAINARICIDCAKAIEQENKTFRRGYYD